MNRLAYLNFRLEYKDNGVNHCIKHITPSSHTPHGKGVKSAKGMKRTVGSMRGGGAHGLCTVF